MDSAPSPPRPSRAARLLWTTAAVVGYPPAFLFAYLLDFGLPYGTIPMETNVSMPVFPVLAALLAAFAYARYRLWRTLRRRFRWRKKVQPFSSPKTQSANRRHRLRWTCPHVWRRIRILSHGCGFRRRTWIIPSCRRMIPMIT